jgi:uncharacterized membrane protein
MEASGDARVDISFGRIVAFTDAVFAIAITLLFLNFEVPQLPAGDDRALGRYLAREAGEFGAYFLTFAVLGRLWVVDHRLFSRLHGFDSWLMSLNLAYSR